MTEQEAREFFDHLPLDERLRLVRDILSDIEGRISRARAELNGESPQLELPEMANQVTSARLDPVGSRGNKSPGSLPVPDDAEPSDELNEFADFDMSDLTGGQSHTVHRLRLMDAAAQYERLLKKYGYVRSVADPKTILRQEQESAVAKGRGKRPKTDNVWADWVAKDADTLDRPYPHEWSDWVALGDEEGEE